MSHVDPRLKTGASVHCSVRMCSFHFKLPIHSYSDSSQQLVNLFPSDLHMNKFGARSVDTYCWISQWYGSIWLLASKSKINLIEISQLNSRIVTKLLCECVQLTPLHNLLCFHLHDIDRAEQIKLNEHSHATRSSPTQPSNQQNGEAKFMLAIVHCPHAGIWVLIRNVSRIELPDLHCCRSFCQSGGTITAEQHAQQWRPIHNSDAEIINQHCQIQMRIARVRHPHTR